VLVFLAERENQFVIVQRRRGRCRRGPYEKACEKSCDREKQPVVGEVDGVEHANILPHPPRRQGGKDSVRFNR